MENKQEFAGLCAGLYYTKIKLFYLLLYLSLLKIDKKKFLGWRYESLIVTYQFVVNFTLSSLHVSLLCTAQRQPGVASQLF